jgi:hypothetical protein
MPFLQNFDHFLCNRKTTIFSPTIGANRRTLWSQHRTPAFVRAIFITSTEGISDDIVHKAARRNKKGLKTKFKWGPQKSGCLRPELTNWRGRDQGCQIFVGTLYQNLQKCTKSTQNFPKGHKISQMSLKYSKGP